MASQTATDKVITIEKLIYIITILLTGITVYSRQFLFLENKILKQTSSAS